MKWLLLILVFDISDGNMRPVHQDTKLFSSKVDCDAAGRNLKNTVKLPSDTMRSMSICIPENAFDDE